MISQCNDKHKKNKNSNVIFVVSNAFCTVWCLRRMGLLAKNNYFRAEIQNSMRANDRFLFIKIMYNFYLL